MKMVAFGTGWARPALTVRSAEQPTETVPRTLYAAVCARDASGAPTAVALPGPLAGGHVELFVQRSDGSLLWVADVRPDGTVKGDGTRADALAAIRPGVKIIAATDRAGHVLALTAAARLPVAGAKAQLHRSAPVAPVRAAGDDRRLAHDPRELLYSGHAGRILSVS